MGWKARVRGGHRPHMLYTEVQSFDEALDILADRAHAKKISESHKGKRLSTKHLLRLDHGRQLSSLYRKQHPVTLAGKPALPPAEPKPPEPQRDMTETVRELYGTGRFKPSEIAKLLKVRTSAVEEALWGPGKETPELTR